MKKVQIKMMFTAAFAATLLTVSCDNGGGGNEPSSSSNVAAGADNYCYYPATQQCFNVGQVAACPGGGELNNCPAGTQSSSSLAVSSSSDIINISSSSEPPPSSSSIAVCQEEYCLCGTDFYSPLTHFCSGSTVYPLCTGETYNPATHRCVENVLLPLCGSTTYQPSTHFCSGTTVYPLCGGEMYNPIAYRCVDDILQPICGSTTYEPSTHFCFSSNIYPLCNEQAYNPNIQFCLNGSVVASKCGGVEYGASQFCLEGQVKDKCDGNTYTADEFCFENQVLAKCNGKTYRPPTQSCYNNSFVMAYCDGVPYNVESKACLVGGETGHFEDYRDGREYKYVTINGQVWMAEDLYGTYRGTAEDLTACPAEFHMPSRDEWEALISYAGSIFKLMAVGWNARETTTDDYGFALVAPPSNPNLPVVNAMWCTSTLAPEPIPSEYLMLWIEPWSLSRTISWQNWSDPCAIRCVKN